MRGEFKSNLFKIFLFFLLLELALTGFLIINVRKDHSKEFRIAMVDINGVKKAMENHQDEEAGSQLDDLYQQLHNCLKYTDVTQQTRQIIMISFSAVLFTLIIYLYIRNTVIQPFHKLESFAKEVAQGKLDLPLEYTRKNIFGAFTWAFDSMRLEVKKARKAEQEAIMNNKTVIATISHDIKTPVASIRAYCEALSKGMDYNEERRNRYINVILKKCDEVSLLTNDLFLHSVSDMEMLKINLTSISASAELREIMDGIGQNQVAITLINEIPDVLILADERRMEQVFENIVGNVVKYAKTSVDIGFYNEARYLKVTIRDYGPGIADEDMPFVFEKFYRSPSVINQPGAGLGLYIAQYIMKQMEGYIELQNIKPGLMAELYFLKTS